jgi:hypothetical protein
MCVDETTRCDDCTSWVNRDACDGGRQECGSHKHGAWQELCSRAIEFNIIDNKTRTITINTITLKMWEKENDIKMQQK